MRFSKLPNGHSFERKNGTIALKVQDSTRLFPGVAIAWKNGRPYKLEIHGGELVEDRGKVCKKVEIAGCYSKPNPDAKPIPVYSSRQQMVRFRCRNSEGHGIDIHELLDTKDVMRRFAELNAVDYSFVPLSEVVQADRKNQDKKAERQEKLLDMMGELVKLFQD